MHFRCRIREKNPNVCRISFSFFFRLLQIICIKHLFRVCNYFRFFSLKFFFFRIFILFYCKKYFNTMQFSRYFTYISIKYFYCHKKYCTRTLKNFQYSFISIKLPKKKNHIWNDNKENFKWLLPFYVKMVNVILFMEFHLYT